MIFFIFLVEEKNTKKNLKKQSMNSLLKIKKEGVGFLFK